MRMNRIDAKVAGANVLTEDGLWLRTCEHGIRHPIGRLAGAFRESEVVNYAMPDGIEIPTQRHEEQVNPVGYHPIKCDGCCANYQRAEYEK